MRKKKRTDISPYDSRERVDSEASESWRKDARSRHKWFRKRKKGVNSRSGSFDDDADEEEEEYYEE